MLSPVLFSAVVLVLWPLAAGHFHFNSLGLPDVINKVSHVDVRKVINSVVDTGEETVKRADDTVGDIVDTGEETVKLAEDTVGDMVRDIRQLLSPADKVAGSGCQCQGKTYDCGCCMYLHIPEIELDDTVCVNITYLPHDYGIRVDFSLDGKVIYSDTISARNPPPLCFAIPGMKHVVSACLDFYNMDIANHTFSGCVKITFELIHFKVINADLGCFSIPLKNKMYQMSTKYDTETLKLFEEKQKDFLKELNLKSYLKKKTM